jgi:hypothetical protein
MTSRDEELAAKLKGYLDQAASDLRPGLAYRLQQARAQAIARLTENPQEAGSGRLVGAHGLLGAGAGGANLGTSSPQRPFLAQGRVWLGVGMIALAALGWQQWTAWQELNEVEDLDAQILTSDLPVDALIDRGFHLFLEVAPTLALMPAPPADDPAGAAPTAIPAFAPDQDAQASRSVPAVAKPAE